MLAWIVLQLPLALSPNSVPPTCQLEVLPPTVLEERVLRHFDVGVNEYVRLHRRLERALPSEHLFGDSEDMSLATDVLHAALVDARPYAREGSIFTPAVAHVLTARLERAIVNLGRTPAEVWIAMNRGYMSGVPEIQVNDRFPPIRYAAIWPVLLDALPALPDELQYRVVDRDLVLVDVHADLVVDILRDALPAPFAGLARDFAAPRDSSQRAIRRQV
jgi:hypothetical protein